MQCHCMLLAASQKLNSMELSDGMGNCQEDCPNRQTFWKAGSEYNARGEGGETRNPGHTQCMMVSLHL